MDFSVVEFSFMDGRRDLMDRTGATVSSAAVFEGFANESSSIGNFGITGLMRRRGETGSLESFKGLSNERDLSIKVLGRTGLIRRRGD